MSEFKCPFCGSESLKIESKTKFISFRNVHKCTMSVRCNKCHARGGTVSGEVGAYAFGTPNSDKLTTKKELEEKAFEKWNTRIPMQNIVERLEKLKEYERNGDCPKDGMCNKKAYECTSCYVSTAIEIIKEEGGAIV